MPKLKFLLDENIPKEVKELLESRGFSAEYVPKGITNSKLASLAKLENTCILTRDSDFLNIASFPPKDFCGIIVFRVHPPKAEKLVKGLSNLLAAVGEFKRKLFIVKEEGFEVIEG